MFNKLRPNNFHIDLPSFPGTSRQDNRTQRAVPATAADTDATTGRRGEAPRRTASHIKGLVEHLKRKKPQSHQGEAPAHDAHASDAGSGTAQAAASRNKHNKYSPKKLGNMIRGSMGGKKQAQPVRQPIQKSSISGPTNPRKLDSAMAKQLGFSGKITTEQVSAPLWVPLNLQDLEAQADTANGTRTVSDRMSRQDTTQNGMDWTRYRELENQLASSGNPRRSLSLGQATGKTADRKAARSAHKNLNNDVILARRSIAGKFEASTTHRKLEQATELIRQILVLSESDRALMRAAVRRFATPDVRIEFEKILSGEKVPSLTAKMEAMVIAVEAMLDSLQDAQAYSGIVSRDALYWLRKNLLVRTDREGRLSFPLPDYGVNSITMSPDQRIHALCLDQDFYKHLITLNTHGVADEAGRLLLPQNTYMLAVANNNTVAIATRDENNQPVLQILNGYDRKEGHTEFSPIIITGETGGNTASPAAGIGGAATEQAVAFPTTREIQSLVFMPEGHLALLFDDKSHWRLEQRPGSDSNDPVTYRAVPVVHLAPDERRHIGRKLVKRNAPERPAPRPAPVPDRLLITPGGALGGVEADGTPLILNMRREWERLKWRHDMSTPLKDFYNNFATDVVPKGGLSAFGFPASADYIKAFANAKGRAFGYGMRKELFPYTLRAADESLLARIKDHWLSHHLPLTPAYRSYRQDLEAGHQAFFGAIEARIRDERDFLTRFAQTPHHVQAGGHDPEFTREATRAIGELLQLITSKLPPKPIEMEGQDAVASASRPKKKLGNLAEFGSKIQRGLARQKGKTPGELAVQDQKLRYENYHQPEDKVRSSKNVLHVAHGALAPILGGEHELVTTLQRLMDDNIFLGFARGENFVSQNLNAKQNHYNEFSTASSLLVSHIWELVTAELKAAAEATANTVNSRLLIEPANAMQTSDGAQEERQIDNRNAPAVNREQTTIPLLNTLRKDVSALHTDAFKQAALRHMRGESSPLFDNNFDGLSAAKNLGVLDISPLEDFAAAYNHYSAAMKQSHHKVKRALRAQGVLGTHEIAGAYEAMLATLPVGSSITVSSRRAGGLDFEGMSLFAHIVAKLVVDGGTVQVFAIEPVTQLTGGRDFALTFSKTENGISVTIGKSTDLTFTPLAFKAQFGIGFNQLSFDRKSVIWAYAGNNLKYKDTITSVYRSSITTTFTDKKASSALQTAVRILSGEASPTEILSRADNATATLEKGLNRTISLDIEPLAAAGIVWDLVTDNFQRQGKALIAAVQQVNFLWKTEDSMAFTVTGEDEIYTFKMMRRTDITNTEILVSEFQGVPVINSIGLDGNTIPNGAELGQQKLQPWISVKTRHIAGTPVTNGGITMEFRPDGTLKGIATSYTYQANFADQSFQKLKEAAARGKAASLETYIPVLQGLLDNASDVDRKRLQEIFRKITRLPRESTVSVQVQYRPEVIAEIQRELPDTRSHIFFGKNDGKLGNKKFLDIATKNPNGVQVSQITINTQNIYKTASSDGVTILRTQSEAVNRFNQASTITITYDSNDTSTPNSIKAEGPYFDDLPTPAYGLLVKQWASLGARQINNDIKLLKFLAAPYGDETPAIENVQLIRDAMNKLIPSRNESYGTIEGLRHTIGSKLSADERTALATLFESPTQFQKEDSLDVLSIFKILSTPEYFAHFQAMNERLLRTPPVSEASEGGTTEEIASQRTVPPVGVATAPSQIVGLGPIIIPSATATPVVQNTRSLRTRSSQGRTTATVSRSAAGASQLSAARRSAASASGEHVPATPVSPAIDTNKLFVGRPIAGAEMRRVTERLEPGDSFFTVYGTSVIGWPEDPNSAFRTRQDVALNLREYLAETAYSSDRQIETLRSALHVNPDLSDEKLLEMAGVQIQQNVMREGEIMKGESTGSSSSDVARTEARRAQVAQSLLESLDTITTETELQPGLYHMILTASQLARAGQVTDEMHHASAVDLRQRVVNSLRNEHSEVVDLLAADAHISFNLDGLINAIRNPATIPADDFYSPSHVDTVNHTGALLQIISTALGIRIELYNETAPMSTIEPSNADGQENRTTIHLNYVSSDSDGGRAGMQFFVPEAPAPDDSSRFKELDEQSGALATNDRQEAQSQAASVRTQSTGA